MKFDYGKDGIEINLDPNWNATILHPDNQKVIENPVKAIRKAIKNPVGCPPLPDIIKNKSSSQTVCIVVSDVTRPVPSHFILEALIKELNENGIENEYITILIATGLHRASRREEIQRIVGEEIAQSKINVINHVAKEKSLLKYLGESSDGSPIYINKHFYEADIKILTGYVEPHFFFGFSGGRKSLSPGIAGEETIISNHSADMIASPHARFGSYKENPMHKQSLEIAEKVEIDFIVNICINEEHKVSHVAAGNLERVHEYLVNYQLQHVFQEIKDPYDIVVCGNGGFPLDLNLYQAVKSMAIGEMGVKKGGTIISVNECREGIGVGQEKFKELIFSGMTPTEIYNKILSKEIVVTDQWQIQVLTRILMKADVFLISSMDETKVGNIGLKSAETVEDAINEALKKHGKQAKILFLPNGPQVLPILKNLP